MICGSYIPSKFKTHYFKKVLLMRLLCIAAIVSVFLAGIQANVTVVQGASSDTTELLTADISIRPSSADVQATPLADAKGQSITIKPGSDKWPGITLKPTTSTVWDLSGRAHLEAVVKNTGDKTIRVSFRVDNPHTQQNRNPWNCELKDIPAGATQTVKVVFGKSWGFQPGYALDSSRVAMMLFFLGKSEQTQSFEILSITPGGKADPASQSASATRAAPDGSLAPKALLDMLNPDLLSLVKGSSDQISIARAHVGEGAGLKAEFHPGADAWPGIRIRPAGSSAWNLSGYSQVRARVANTGNHPMSLSLRVDNPSRPDNSNTWNCEGLTIAPGQTATLIVNFGHSFGGKGYDLDPSNVNSLLLFCSKLNVPVAFKVESIVAGNKTDSDAQYKHKEVDLRFKPKDGLILGGADFDADKQARGHHHGKVRWNAAKNVLDIELPRQNSRAQLMPLKGYWHLGDGNQLAVTIQNTGTDMASPRVRLASQAGAIEQTSSPIKPGQIQTLILSFIPEVPWQGYWSATQKGKHSVDGTGTKFNSDKCNELTIHNDTGKPATLQVKRIVCETALADIPDWVGKRPPVEGDWVQTMDDNFDGSTLNTTNWSNTGPNYWDKVSRWSPKNAIMGEGVVRLRYEKKYGPHNDDPNARPRNLTGKIFADYTGGYLETDRKFTQRYGYFEARMKLPATKGLWPAFWMMPDRGPDVPRAERGTTRNGGMEFDIMEALSVWGPHRYNVAFHWDDYGSQHKSIGTNNIYFAPDKEGFFTAGLLWLPGKAVFYANGQEVGRWENDRICNVPAYMMFTMPNGGWDGNVLDDSDLPDDFIIDYVRVWQRKDLMQK